MAERDEPVACVGDAHEAAVAAPGDVLEEHPLDGIASAELEHLLVPRLDEVRWRRRQRGLHSAILASR